MANYQAENSAHFDIIIAGAGLVGASMACAIATNSVTASLRIAVIDPGNAPASFSDSEFDPRVVALTRQSQSFLESLGVWRDIVASRVCPYVSMNVWDGEGNAAIEFNAEELRQPDLGHIVENSVVLHALLDLIDTQPSVTLLRGVEVEKVQSAKDFHSLTLIQLSNGQCLTSPLLIAADGAHSPIRQQLNFQTREWNYGHHAIVTTVRCENSHQYTAWQRFMHTGPLAFLPLAHRGDSHYASIVWSVQEDIATELMALNDEHFSARLESAFESRLGAIESIAKRFCFPLKQRHATTYFQRGVVLVGDAAHTIHPLAGQGVNIGLQDVIALASEITRAIERGIPLSDESLLQRYQRVRKPANLAMMSAMEGFKRLFGQPHPAAVVLRNMGMRQMNKMMVLKNALAKHAMGL